jgi:hypothetical protein
MLAQKEESANTQNAWKGPWCSNPLQEKLV